LPNAEANGSVLAIENMTSCALSNEGANVPLGEAEHARCADLVREDVGEEPVHDLLPICPGIFGGSICGHDASDCLADDLSISRKVIGGVTGIETVAEIFVKLGAQRVDHRKTHAVDRTPSPSVGGEG